MPGRRHLAAPLLALLLVLPGSAARRRRSWPPLHPRRQGGLRLTALLLALLLALPGSAARAHPDGLRLQGLRGATTAEANTPDAIRSAVAALMQELIARNRLQADQVVSATFSATADLDALFPASVARRLPGWDRVALLDVQQLAVRGDLPRCIRVLLLSWLPASQAPQHVYLGEAARLRPDRARRP